MITAYRLRLYVTSLCRIRISFFRWIVLILILVSENQRKLRHMTGIINVKLVEKLMMGIEVVVMKLVIGL